MSNQQLYNILTLLNVNGTTAASTGSYVDATPSASISKRSMKVITVANGVSGTSPTFPISILECDTTNGTFTALVAGTVATVTTNGVAETHVVVTKRYLRCDVGTVGGTGTPTASLAVLIQNLKREF